MSLPPPARYYPFVYDGGRYAVKAGLYPLETDFGNGAVDRRILQRDTLYATYVAAKHEAAARAATAAPALAIEVDTACAPAVREHVRGHLADVLVRDGLNTEAEIGGAPLPTLAMLLQEDVAIVETDTSGGTRLTYQHVSLPSGWSPWSKRGRTFAEVHKPVPGAGHIDGDALMREIVAQGQVWVRFVWGLQFEDRLDQHPRRGRRSTFDAALGLWLRVERQVVIGLPAAQALLFLIRPYVLPVPEVVADASRGRALLSALEAMSEAERRYKHVRRDHAAITDFIRARLPA